jgi:hypothetical protein
MSCAQLTTGNKTAFFTVALLFFGILFFRVIFFGAHAIAKEPTPAPLAVVAETTINFPPVIAGKTVEHGFLIKNTGPVNLDILNVYTG